MRGVENRSRPEGEYEKTRYLLRTFSSCVIDHAAFGCVALSRRVGEALRLMVLDDHETESDYGVCIG